MSLEKYHVAIINSDSNRLTALSGMLGMDEYLVSTYQNPLDMLKAITTENHFDMIITNLHHPDINARRASAAL